MRIMVTGSDGFIGRHMVRALVDGGHDVTQYDIKTADALPELEGHDWCIHLGAVSSTTTTDVELVRNLNIEFSIWLLRACLDNNVNLQYASSASVYGRPPAREPFREDQMTSPMNLYAESKVAFETAVDMINPKIIVQGFRYFNVYGEGDDHKGDQASPHTKFRSQYSETGRISVFHGSENFVRDFVPVEDVCRMHTLFLRVPESGIWNVGTGETTSFLQVALSIAPIENIDFIDMPENVKNHYQQYTCADMTKTRETLRRHGIET